MFDGSGGGYLDAVLWSVTLERLYGHSRDEEVSFGWFVQVAFARDRSRATEFAGVAHLRPLVLAAASVRLRQGQDLFLPPTCPSSFCIPTELNL